MKTISIQTRFASFVIAILLLLQISPALAGGPHEQRGRFSWPRRSHLLKMGL